MILILTGTDDHPFDRLVDAGVPLAAAGRVVQVQRGASRRPTPGCAAVDLAPPATIATWLAAADIVICHGGPSTIREAWAAGHRPIVVPRDPARGEHVDAHQRDYAATLGDRAHVLEDLRRLPDLVASLGSTRAEVGVDAGRVARQAAHLARVVRDLLRG